MSSSGLKGCEALLHAGDRESFEKLSTGRETGCGNVEN
jgi:hypothetical protein